MTGIRAKAAMNAGVHHGERFPGGALFHFNPHFFQMGRGLRGLFLNGYADFFIFGNIPFRLHHVIDSFQQYGGAVLMPGMALSAGHGTGLPVNGRFAQMTRGAASMICFPKCRRPSVCLLSMALGTRKFFTFTVNKLPGTFIQHMMTHPATLILINAHVKVMGKYGGGTLKFAEYIFMREDLFRVIGVRLANPGSIENQDCDHR
jgi:hypothetical protein